MAIIGRLETKVVKGNRIGQYRVIPTITPVKVNETPILAKTVKPVATVTTVKS